MESERMGSAGSDTRSFPLKFWFPPFALMALIFALSSKPASFYPAHHEFLNNLAHFTEFGLLSFFLSRALYRGHYLSGRGLFLWTVLLCAIFGLLDEVHQFLVPQRMFDLFDLIIDMSGAAAGSVLYIFWSGLKRGEPAAGTAVVDGSDD